MSHESDESRLRLARENAAVAEIGRIIGSSAVSLQKLTSSNRLSIGMIDVGAGTFEDSSGYLGLISTTAQDAANVVNRLRESYRSPREDDAFAPRQSQGLAISRTGWAQEMRGRT